MLDRTRWSGCNFCAQTCEKCIYYGMGRQKEPCHSCRVFSKFVSHFPGKYCRECGRPLTEQAWEELERRIVENDGKTDETR